MEVKNLEFTPQFTKALELLENSSRSIFVTGHAGTGKSTLLDHFRNTTTRNIVVLAPTGVAALNVQGQTIHSFFGLRPGVTPENIRRYYRNRGKQGFYKAIDAIVIDEISMVRADLLDVVDEFLRMHGKDPNQPFGGIRMIFVGDLHQLPPVVTNNERNLFKSYYESPFFFSAKAIQNFPLEVIELDKIYRQDDENFINILNAIRSNSLDEVQLKELNKRHLDGFSFDKEDFYIYLTTTNRKADQINQRFLGEITGTCYTYTASKSGDFDKKIAPASLDLELKVGAQIMLTNNDKGGRWVNGSVGKIVEIIKLEKGKDIVVIELDTGETVEVLPYTWEVFKYAYNPATDKLQSESVGSFTQYPLILAWAVTIHKSQGKTFDKVVVDFGWGTFAHGQAYVALSRCRNLEGLILARPFNEKHIITDGRINNFLQEFSLMKKPWEMDNQAKKELLAEAIKAGKLLKIKYYLSEDKSRDHMVNFESFGTEGEIEGFCYVIGEKVLLKIDSIIDITEVEDIA